MRKIEITYSESISKHPGKSVSIPVKVDWPELRLTQDQVMANAVADADGEERPYPDNSYIEIVINRGHG